MHQLELEEERTNVRRSSSCGKHLHQRELEEKRADGINNLIIQLLA
jgi:hypothetical protein